METPAQEARRVAADSSLTFEARRARINQLAETERRRLGTDRAPSVECHLEALSRAQGAARSYGSFPSPESQHQVQPETQGSGVS